MVIVEPGATWPWTRMVREETMGEGRYWLEPDAPAQQHVPAVPVAPGLLGEPGEPALRLVRVGEMPSSFPSLLTP